jgi:hypothetical protein
MNTGLWIDHHRAVLVSHTEQNVDVKFLISDMERERWRLAVWQVPDRIRQRMLDDQIGRFYQNVSACIMPAKFILIFGPDKAKDELRKQLGLDNFKGSIVGVEQAGGMTDIQIIARIGTTFDNPKPAKTSHMTLEKGVAT